MGCCQSTESENETPPQIEMTYMGQQMDGNVAYFTPPPPSFIYPVGLQPPPLNPNAPPNNYFIPVYPSVPTSTPY